MDNIEINVNIPELEAAAKSFKNHTMGAIHNVENTINGIKRLGEYWSGAKFKNVIDEWNERISLLRNTMMDWDSRSNMIFQEIFAQYESDALNNDFIDVELNIDETLYEYIGKPIDITVTPGTRYIKERVEHEMLYSVKGYLGCVGPNIKNTYVLLQEQLPTSTSTALKNFMQRLEESTITCSKTISELLDGFYAKLEERKKEVDIIEERANSIINKAK